jgi:hypothetical protein
MTLHQVTQFDSPDSLVETRHGTLPYDLWLLSEVIRWHYSGRTLEIQPDAQGRVAAFAHSNNYNHVELTDDES